ncbi:MAG: ATP-binding cassette domain-containing protein [Clostridiales Family XIII bacterium]|jgi:peptide/nickel transport system ATP-binding protein|nr:ATP-binding cassette domain-containing protein [Clostridiales Family XIII bacterium]
MRLEAHHLDFRYPKTDKWILKDVSLTVGAGERLALVGPSGSGKSTLSALLSGCLAADAGTVLWDGKPLPVKGYCPVQLIRQHPELSVNPRRKMGKILCESWTPDKALLEKMGIEERWMTRWPAELSGGELQRFCIARVLGPRTKFLICDEISTMLDVITQAQIWRLILDVTVQNGLGLIVVTHNPALAKRVCDRAIDLTDINAARP